MDINQLFEKYRRRLVHIGLRKSLLWGIAIGFAAEFITAFALWFFDLSLPVAIGIMLGVLVLTTGLAALVVYVLFFRPSRRKIARMIDALGLEERLITMCERESDESHMAALQRNDAVEKLSFVDEKRFVFHLPKLTAITLSVTMVLGLVMGVVSTLSAGGMIAGGNEIFVAAKPAESETPPEEEDSTCVIVYEAGEGGIVEGETVQRLEKGQDTTPVSAVPDEGYTFVGWSDGDPRATRVDYSVQASMTVVAKFVKAAIPEIPEIEGAPGDDGGSEGEIPGGDIGLGGGAGGSGNSGEMEGEDVNGDAGGGAGAMKDKEDNSVIDGATDYKYEFDYEAEMEDLLNDESLSDEVKDFLNDYLDALKQLQESEKV